MTTRLIRDNPVHQHISVLAIEGVEVAYGLIDGRILVMLGDRMDSIQVPVIEPGMAGTLFTGHRIKEIKD